MCLKSHIISSVNVTKNNCICFYIRTVITAYVILVTSDAFQFPSFQLDTSIYVIILFYFLDVSTLSYCVYRIGRIYVVPSIKRHM